MILQNQETQRAIQYAVRQSCDQLNGEKTFADEFARACVDLDINSSLPSDINPIPRWDDAGIAYGASQRLFRYLGMKEKGGKYEFDVNFFSWTFSGLLAAMPESIRIDLMNSQYADLGVHVVARSEAQDSDSIEELKNPSIKEASEFLAAAASMPDSPTIDQLKKVVKEGPEASIAIEALVDSCQTRLDRMTSEPKLRKVG